MEIPFTLILQTTNLFTLDKVGENVCELYGTNVFLLPSHSKLRYHSLSNKIFEFARFKFNYS